MVQELPLILAKKRDASALIGTKDAVTFGLSSLVGAATKAAELLPLLAEELLRHLHRKLHETASAKSRAHWFGGRIYNWALGADLNYITMSGAHLRQVFLLFDLTLPLQIDPGGPYLLRADFARQAHDILGARLGVAKDALAQGLQ
ncbi:MAG: hypothetical protein ACSHXB_13830 [Sulfitobacter sp.]